MECHIEVWAEINRDLFQDEIAKIKTIEIKYLQSDNHAHHYFAKTAYTIDFVKIGELIERLYNNLNRE